MTDAMCDHPPMLPDCSASAHFTLQILDFQSGMCTMTDAPQCVQAFAVVAELAGWCAC
jgi:hypothetical protein